IIDYSKRVLQITRILLGQLWKAASRYRRKQPIDGPILLREGLEAAGGTFVKFGQILSLQVDILPREYCDSLLGLLDRVPTASNEAIAGVFGEEFGGGPEAVYARFEYKALGSASIGQVHKAMLRDGTSVAVKVQRPGVHYDFRRDVALMNGFVRLIVLFR